MTVPGPEIVKAVKEMMTQAPEKMRYKVIIILLVGVAAYSTAMKDLNRLQELVGSVQEVASGWLDAGLVTANAKDTYVGEVSCSNNILQSESATEFRWSGRVAPGLAIEVKGINGDIKAEAANRAEAEVVALKRSTHNDPGSVEIKVVEHARGVTICAVYPSDDSGRPNTCEPGQGGRMSVRNNDVKVDFTVRVPAMVSFEGRTVNGEISATSLGGNVVTHTVNGGIQISTSGYAQAKTVNGEISAKIGDANWPDALEFKTVNGEINLDLPPNISTNIRAETFNGEISSDFPLSVQGKIGRKHLNGTIGSGGRELVLKTLNGSIRLRRAS